MKIGIVVQCPSPHQKVLLDSLFKVDGIDPRIAYAYADSPGRNWGTPKADGPTAMLPYRIGPGCTAKLRDWVRSERCDVWVLGSVFTCLRTQLLANVLQESGRRWVFLGEPPRPRTGLRRTIRDYVLARVVKRCHGVIATGTESARRYQVLLGDSCPVTSVPYYIPLDDWLAHPLVASPLRGQPVRFVTLAQLIHRKGLDLLIEASRHLPRDGWTLDIYGEGPERGRLQRQIDKHRLPIVLNRPLPFADRMDAFNGKHCFVFPTRWDGWGMALVEALAAGAPVISSDQAMSAHDFIREGVNGRIVPCEPAAIKAAMADVMEHPERLGDQSRAARASVSSYNPDLGARELVRFCRAVLDADGKFVPPAPAG